MPLSTSEGLQKWTRGGGGGGVLVGGVGGGGEEGDVRCKGGTLPSSSTRQTRCLQ